MPPHDSVGAKTLARWTTDVLKNGGVDITMWQQHSIRAAGAAHHRKSGLTAEDICELANWSHTSGTYKKYYERFV